MTRRTLPIIGLLCSCAIFVHTCELRKCADQLRTKTPMDECCSQFEIITPGYKEEECDWDKCAELLGDKNAEKDPCCENFPVKKGRCPDPHTSDARFNHETKITTCPNSTCDLDMDCPGSRKCCEDIKCGDICREAVKNMGCDLDHHEHDENCEICSCVNSQLICVKFHCPTLMMCGEPESEKYENCCGKKCIEFPDH